LSSREAGHGFIYSGLSHSSETLGELRGQTFDIGLDAMFGTGFSGQGRAGSSKVGICWAAPDTSLQH
jgi:NAD(P)H-hydrate repair Nnr-like enzyme with NAD(P)H-hydrate epimerase domain